MGGEDLVWRRDRDVRKRKAGREREERGGMGSVEEKRMSREGGGGKVEGK